MTILAEREEKQLQQREIQTQIQIQTDRLQTKKVIIFFVLLLFVTARVVTAIICLVMISRNSKNKKHKTMTIVDVVLYVVCVFLLFTLLYYEYCFNVVTYEHLVSFFFICIFLMLYISSKIVMLIKYDALNRKRIILCHLPDTIICLIVIIIFVYALLESGGVGMGIFLLL